MIREQFGRTIGSFQGVKHQLANIATDLEPSLSLLWYSAHALDHIQDLAERHTALTKARTLGSQVAAAVEMHLGSE